VDGLQKIAEFTPSLGGGALGFGIRKTKHAQGVGRGVWWGGGVGSNGLAEKFDKKKRLPGGGHEYGTEKMTLILKLNKKQYTNKNTTKTQQKYNTLRWIKKR